MDSVKADNERELTSTMGNVLSMSSKDEKNDTSDATPTSSTDANTTPTASRIVSDDPISSTSSDIEQIKSKASEANMQNCLELDENAVDEPNKSSSTDPEADLLEMSISNVSNEKITEDVEDLVHDLESLLGESTDSFNIPIKRKEDRKSPSESEDRKSLDGKDVISPDESEAGKVPDEKGDAVDQKEINNRPQTSSEGIQEIISSDDTISEEVDQDTETKLDGVIPDENNSNTQREVQECEQRQTAERNKESDIVPKEVIDEDDKESNKPVNEPCPSSDKDQENSTNSEVSETPRVDVVCKVVSDAIEEKSDMLHKENNSSEEVVENVGDSAVPKGVECVVVSKATIEEENREHPSKQVDIDDVSVEESVEKSGAENIETVEQSEEAKVESKSKDFETIENPQDIKENETTPVIEDTPTDDKNENDRQETADDISSVSEKEDALDVKSEPTTTVEIPSCNEEPNSSKESLKGNEQCKEEEVKDSVEGSPEGESIAVVTQLTETVTEDTDKEKGTDTGIKEHISELPSYDSQSKIMEISVIQNEAVEVDPYIPDAEQSKEGCGQVDGTVTENEENKLQTETASNKETVQREEDGDSKELENKVQSEAVLNEESAGYEGDGDIEQENKLQTETGLNTETANYEADGDSKQEEIPTQCEVQEISEPVTEEVGNETSEEAKESAEDEELNNVAVVTESESQVNIPVEIIAEDAEPKMETCSQEPHEKVIDDSQCVTPSNTDEVISIESIDETATSNPTEMDCEPSKEMETSESPVAENVTPEVSTDVEFSVSSENKEIVALVSKSGRVEDDSTEADQYKVENKQPVNEPAVDISEDIEQVENPKSPNIVPSKSTEENVILKSEESKPECVESVSESAEHSTEISQSESKEIVQPVAQSEVMEDIAVVVQSETAKDEKFDESEGQSLEQNITDETHKEYPVEMEIMEATTPISAEEISPDTAENDSESLKVDLETKITVSNDEHPELTEESLPNEETHKVNKEMSSTNQASLQEPCETGNDISNSADESSIATENISELNEETAKPVEETSAPVEETLQPAEETSEPAEETLEPAEEASEPAEKTSEPAEETLELAEEASEPADEASEPAEKTSEPAEATLEPAEEILEQAEKTSEPAEATIEPAEEILEPAEEASEPAEMSVPAEEISEPVEETSKPDDEMLKPSAEISEQVEESSKLVEKASEPAEEILEPIEETSEPAEETLELAEETSEPAEETLGPAEETSEPIEEDTFEPGDISTLQKEAHQEIATKKLPETECNIESTPDQIIEDVRKPEGNEKVETSVDLTEESEEKSSIEEMVVEPNEEDKEDSDKVIEISDEDSKTADQEPESIQISSSSTDSDSEEVVPVLALEPDEDTPSPKEPVTGRDDTEVEDSSVEDHSSDMAAVTEPLPEIEEILTDQGRVDEAVVETTIDMQENLETMLAVASLQNIENTQVTVQATVEPEMSEKERREMEALRKAVESITESTTNDFVDDVNDVELIADVVVPNEGIAMEPEIIEASESNLLQGIAPELAEDKVDTVIEIDKTDLALKVGDSAVDESDEDAVELKIVESAESVQVVEEDSVEEVIVELKPDKEAEGIVQALPDTSEDKVIDCETKQPETRDVLPDSSQSVTSNEEAKQAESSRDKETKTTKINERPKRHKKSSTDNKLEELSINVDVPDKEKPYSPKVTIKPIKVPDEEVSTTSNSDSEIGKGSLKMTITKQSDKMHSILKICDPESSEATPEQEEPIPKLIIKPKIQQVEQQHSPKMSTRSSRQVYSPTSSTQRSGSPRITIKPVVKPEKTESISPLKIKIKPDDTPKKHNPKVNIKSIVKPDDDAPKESVQSPRKVIIKPVVKPVEEPEQQVHSPRITIKPIPKPETEKEPATPRLNIKPIKKQEEDDSEVEKERSSPKITIKPVVKPQEPDTQTAEGDEEVKERIVLKINKGNLPSPTKDPKKREHPPDDDKSEKLAKITVKFSKGGGHAHIVQQPEESNKRPLEEQSSPEKFKKQKTEIESPISTRSKHKEAATETPVETRSKHKEVPAENPTGDSVKMKQKEIEPVHESLRTKHKDPMPECPIEPKRAKLKDTAPETPVYESTRSSRHKDTVKDHKEIASEVHVSEATKSKPNASEKTESNNENADDVKIVETKLDSPIVISEDSRSQDSGSCVIVDELKDPLSAIPVFEITAESAKAMVAKSESVSSTPSTPPTPTPRKRGRPRKVPIVVREDFKEQEDAPKPDASKGDAPPAVPESGRPKRSCRGQSARATLGIKPRKPRGPGRGRGSKRGMGTRSVPMKPEGEVKLSKAKLKLMQQSIKEELAKTAEIVGKEKKTLRELEGILASNVGIKPPADVGTSEIPSASPFTIFPVPSPQGPPASLATLPSASPKSANSLLTAEALESAVGVPVVATTSGTESSELVMVDEETRMSADTNSRAQTPAKQVIPADAVIEESQSSVQSTATTESGKARPSKAPRLEVQEPEGAVISADQLTEYYWNGNGPFMLQEQVAQFLGIKSFKRKYPGIMRRMLEMQERDFIRESGLASEHMCDLGLTAVNSADILDIMYSDFQDKYEEYCKHQRDRQAKDLINKQKALTLAASQEKNKADITEQAVQSAAQWNATFNKTRKEQRKACMDLQTLTVHYPKGKIKQINKAKVGNYPVALVPGQFTDYYQDFTPTEINNLPINTMCYDPINIIPPEESDDSGSEGSDSDSDSSSSSSGSGSDSSSGVEDCKLCKHTPKKSATAK